MTAVTCPGEHHSIGHMLTYYEFPNLARIMSVFKEQFVTRIFSIALISYLCRTPAGKCYLISFQESTGDLQEANAMTFGYGRFGAGYPKIREQTQLATF